jgi:hypothetical protein
MDTKAIKPEDNKGGTFTAQLTAEEVTSASITPVPTQAPGIIWAEPGTVKEEAIYYKTRDAEAGTIGGLTRDFTNLNGGTGQQHENSADWEVLQSSKIIENLIDIVTEGYIQEQNTIARVDDTSFTVAGNVSAIYNAGRTIRFNQDNAELVTVVSATYAAGTGLTTIVITDDTIPVTLTTAEYSLQPKGVALAKLSKVLTLDNTTEFTPDADYEPSTKKYVDDEIIEAIATLPKSGWEPISDTWTYASASTITVPAGAESLYQKGDKLRLKQGGGYKYYYIIGVADTVLTVTGGTDYTVADAAITDIAYSHQENPIGFPDWFTYSPVILGATFAGTGSYDVQIGRFKISGKSCTFRNHLQWTNHTGTGDLRATHPLTSANIEPVTAIYNGYITALTFPASSIDLVGYLAKNSTNIIFRATKDNSNSAIAMDTAATMIFAGTYEI